MMEAPGFIDVMSYALIALKLSLWVFGLVFLFNGLNDLFFDVVKLARTLWRRVVILGLRRAAPLREEDLMAKPEQPIAIMIPCWDESAVIRRMVENTVNVLTYSNYVIFVGTYPNDPKTQREVALIRERFENVELVVCPKDGPTSKADCLNWIYEGIRHYEKNHAMSFAIHVMEDSEDVVHPLTLKLFNYLIPRKDMVQIPVFPMEPRWFEFTRGSYLDEFAMNHSRDMIVREILSRNLPSAGVGTALSQKLVERLYAENNHQLFTIGSVTEDYDFGVRLHNMPGIKQIFARVAVARTRRRKHPLTGRERLVTIHDYIGIREYFPNTFRAAVRQKGRWVLGITLQAWETIGWFGGFWMRYLLFRDRISLLTNQVTMLANVLVPVYLLIWGYVFLFPDAYRFPPIVQAHTPLYYLLLANVSMLAWLLCIRFYYVAALYDLKQAMLSPFRLVWANVINYFATMRALKLYYAYRISGKPIAWDKTDHAYPSEAELVRYRRRLGDLLLDRRFLTVKQLDSALERQRETGQSLGAVLTDMGFVSENQLLQVLGMQLSLQTTEIDPYSQDIGTIRLIPRELAKRYQVYPLHLAENGELVVAVDRVPSPEELQELEAQIHRKVQLRLTTRGELGFALRRGYERLQHAETQHQLDKTLVDKGLVSQAQLDEALEEQRRSYRKLGDLLVANGYLTQQDLDSFTSSPRWRSNAPSLGEQLVSHGLISKEQLTATLEEQKNKALRLGDILVAKGVLGPQALNAALREG